MLRTSKGGNYTSPYDVPISKALDGKQEKISQSFIKKTQKVTPFFFLFVRNPFSRILSAFIDKLVAPNPTYWKAFGSKSVRLFRTNPSVQSKNFGHDVTFQEFVKYVTRSEANSTRTDEHLVSIFSRCRPCDTRYTYVGTMETFKDDVYFILRKSGMNDTLQYLSDGDTFETLYVDDAIADSIYSPFSWRKDIIKIITWDQALRRIWLKLQMRGIIAFTEKFDSYVNAGFIKSENITAVLFIKVAKIAHGNSDPAELKKQKLGVMKEAFMTLTYDELIAFRNTYSYDFRLFGYEDSPKILFDRPLEKQAPTKYFNYTNLN